MEIWQFNEPGERLSKIKKTGVDIRRGVGVDE